MSVSTIKKHRTSMGFTATKPKFIPHIREANKVKRLDFCQQLIATNDQFNDVIFTDESSFQIGQHRQIVMTRIVRNEKGKIISRDVPQIPKLKHPLKVHVWGGISRKGSTQLVIFGGIMNAEFYTKEILEKTLLPFIQEFFPAPLSHRFWQDNDPKHTSKMAKKFLETNHINWFKTPAESPDLNMIENVWATLKYYVSKDNPRTQQELADSLLNNWKIHVTVEKCNNYINHLQNVLPKVVQVNGDYSGC